MEDLNAFLDCEEKKEGQKNEVISEPVIEKVREKMRNKNILDWENGFEKWELHRMKVPKDGHSMIHSLCAAFFKPYIEETEDGQLQIVKKLRKELAMKLAQHVPGQKVRYHDVIINNLKYKNLKTLPEYSLSGMQKLFYSDEPVTGEHLEYISQMLNKDIYIIDNHETPHLGDVYSSPLRDRPSIVLLHKNNHYDVVGLMSEQKMRTHFRATHDFIQFLRTFMR